jgi:hypothetical protein
MKEELHMVQENALLRKFNGPLTVTLIIGGRTYQDFKHLCLIGGTTLFDYVGQAAAVIFTNMTAQLVIRTAPQDWEIIEFSPAKQILTVRQVGGEKLVLKEEDGVKLSGILGASEPYSVMTEF